MYVRSRQHFNRLLLQLSDRNIICVDADIQCRRDMWEVAHIRGELGKNSFETMVLLSINVLKLLGSEMNEYTC